MHNYAHHRVSPSRKSRPFKYSYSEAMKLNDYEVVVSFLKYLIQMAIFAKPAIIKKYGLTNAVLSTTISLILVMVSNYNFIRSMQKMPK